MNKGDKSYRQTKFGKDEWSPVGLRAKIILSIYYVSGTCLSALHIY